MHFDPKATFNSSATTFQDLDENEITDEMLLRQIKELEGEKKISDLKLKQFFVRKVAKHILRMIIKDPLNRPPLHDRYFAYYVPNSKDKYILFYFDCDKFSSSVLNETLVESGFSEEKEKTASSCYNFLSKAATDELQRRELPLNKIEPSLKDFQNSTLIKIAVLSVMKFIESSEESLIKKDTFWQEWSSYVPLSDPYKPNGVNEIDNTISDLIAKQNEQIRKKLLGQIYNRVISLVTGVSKSPHDKDRPLLDCKVLNSRLGNFNNYLAKFNENVQASPIKIKIEGNRIPVKLICYNYLLDKTKRELMGKVDMCNGGEDSLNFNFYPNFLKKIVIEIMQENDESVLAILSDYDLWNNNSSSYRKPIIEESNCFLS